MLIEEMSKKMEILIDWRIMTVYFNGLVYFTVGASQYCGHEIEFKVNLNPEQAKELIDAIVVKCKAEQQKLDETAKIRLFRRDIFFKKMVSVVDSDTFAWRMVVPDNNGRLPDNPKCHPGFKNQLEIYKDTRN